MKKTATPKFHSLPYAFLLMLIGAFALSALALTLVGTRIYKHVNSDAIQNSDAQVALTYIGNKVHAFDTQGGIALTTIGQLPVLRLHETIAGQSFVTLIYAYQGQIRENTLSTQEPFDPTAGEALANVHSLQFSMLTPSLLEATVELLDGETQTLRMALLSAINREAL